MAYDYGFARRIDAEIRRFASSNTASTSSPSPNAGRRRETSGRCGRAPRSTSSTSSTARCSWASASASTRPSASSSWAISRSSCSAWRRCRAPKPVRRPSPSLARPSALAARASSASSTGSPSSASRPRGSSSSSAPPSCCPRWPASHVSTPLKVVFIILAAAIQAVMPYLGHATMVKVLRALIIPFGAIFVLLAIYDIKHGSTSFKGFGGGWELYTAGLAFTIALSGLGWTECGNDYTRYLPRDAQQGLDRRMDLRRDGAARDRHDGPRRGDVHVRLFERPGRRLERREPLRSAARPARSCPAGSSRCSHLRDRPALRHQLARPLLLGRVAAGDGAAPQALPGGRARLDPRVRAHDLGRVPVDVLALHEGVRRGHHRVDRAVVRDHAGRLAHASLSLQRGRAPAPRLGRPLLRGRDRHQLERHRRLRRGARLRDARASRRRRRRSTSPSTG